MATLQKIRDKAGALVAVVIGLALFAFILGDFLSGGGSLSSSSDYEIAQVGDVSVSYQEYQILVDKMVENQKKISQSQSIDEATTDKVREQAWQTLIMNYAMSTSYVNLGIDVCSDELFDMVQGNNIAPEIKQNFVNQQTGQFDRGLVINYLKNLDKDETGNSKAIWLAFEKSLQDNRRIIKYNTLIKKGLYVPSFLVKHDVNEKNKSVAFQYVVKKYNTIIDSTISVSDDELDKYYQSHLNKYEQEASRNVEYITFDVVASDEDIEKTKKWITEIKSEFEITENDAQFIGLNSDNSFVDYYSNPRELNIEFDSIMFAADSGFVYGPYLENNMFKLAKLSDIKDLPDSVKAKHILIQPSEEMSFDVADALSDSLIDLLNNGANFIDIAQRYSMDKGSLPEGGSLGWFSQGMMVKPFEKACFDGEIGEIQKVNSQFGIHIIQVEEKGVASKKVLVSYVEREILPSSTTYQNIFGNASKFAGKNNTSELYINAIKEQGITKRIAANLKETDKNIAGLESARELVRWAYTAEKDDISPVLELGSRFVVALLTESKEKGTAPFEQVTEQIKTIVVQNKKSDQLKLKLAGNSIDEISKSNELQILEAENINFHSFSIQGSGIEPIVISIASSLEKDAISKPIKGNNGVYVVKINEIKTLEQANEENERRTIQNDFSTRVDYQAYEAIKKSLNIVDKRAKFF